jgi:hypothetical protein
MVKAILNTKPDVWPPEPIDEGKPFKWQTRQIVYPIPVNGVPSPKYSISLYKKGDILRMRQARTANKDENGFTAAGLFIKVKNVRVERLQDISEEDVKAEGVSVPPLPTCADPSLKRRCEFASLWDDLYAKRGYGWDSNPWVWVIEFMRVEKGVKE